MSMLKVIEVLAESPDSFDAAVEKASKSVRNIKSVSVRPDRPFAVAILLGL